NKAYPGLTLSHFIFYLLTFPPAQGRPLPTVARTTTLPVGRDLLFLHPPAWLIISHPPAISPARPLARRDAPLSHWDGPFPAAGRRGRQMSCALPVVVGW